MGMEIFIYLFRVYSDNKYEGFPKKPYDRKKGEGVPAVSSVGSRYGFLEGLSMRGLAPLGGGGHPGGGGTSSAIRPQ